VFGQFFNVKGKEINCDLHRRTVALSLKDLKKTKSVIGIAGGKGKVKAISGALRGGYINILITDEETAEEAINLETRAVKTG